MDSTPPKYEFAFKKSNLMIFTFRLVFGFNGSDINYTFCELCGFGLSVKVLSTKQLGVGHPLLCVYVCSHSVSNR